MHRLVAVLVVSVAAAGCSASTVTGAGQLESPSASTGSTTSDFPAQSSTTTSTTTTTPTPTPVPTASTTSAAPPRPTDITDVRYTRPKGFVYGKGYHPVTPLESRRTGRYLVPSGGQGGLDVLSITIYGLPAAHRPATASGRLARVKAYNRRVGARVLDGPTATDVDGFPAVEETAIEQGTYRYVAFFVFGTKHLLEVSCQVDRKPKTIQRGCTQLLESIKL